MTTTVTKESLAARIAELESGTRSLKEDYTLAAYKMLLSLLEEECDHYWIVGRKHIPEVGYVRTVTCNKCGRKK